MTSVILAQAAVTGTPLAEQFLAAFLANASGNPTRLLPEALTRRAADPAMSTTETAALDRAATLIRALCLGAHGGSGLTM